MCKFNKEHNIWNNNHSSIFSIFYELQLHICDLILEKEGVFGYVTTDEFQLDLIPLDRDILSLQMPAFFTSYFLVSKIYKTMWLYRVIICEMPKMY